ncbi:MAG: response regulator transcription factor [Cytophagaceae bacterium]|nr:response regulator transcription factor [Cytophagaceae bacterium]MBL0301659.1 response regulator transcription factor [Cytophagaceae bacterium]MBL0324484.1 response regulator transcription factor [Cytophagaceae bacterium]
MKSRILIADDHQLFGNGLKELLSKESYLQVFGPEKTPQSIIHAVKLHHPSILLLDVNLDGINGIELGEILKKDYPEMAIIIITMYNQAHLIEKSKNAGLDGYLLKDCETDVLLQSINRILNGEKIFVTQKDYDVTPVVKDDFLLQYQLTEREKEIIKLLTQGKSNTEIGESLFLSFHTIKTHRKNIYNKLGISNLIELVEIAQKMHL